MENTAISETYKAIESILENCCRKFRRSNHQFTLDELMSEARLAFCAAYARYEPDYGSFKNWIFEKAWDSLKEYRRNWYKWYRRNPNQDMDTFGRDDYEYLSSDANRIIRIVLRLSSKSKQRIMRSKQPREVLFQMLLRKKRWSGKPKRLTKAIRELTEIF